MLSESDTTLLTYRTTLHVECKLVTLRAYSHYVKVGVNAKKRSKNTHKTSDKKFAFVWCEWVLIVKGPFTPRESENFL